MANRQVLLQEWMTDLGFVRSVSKDKAQLDAAIAELKEKEAEPEGDPCTVEIPDNHGLAEMVDSGTVFLTEDEYAEVIIFPDGD